jgi:threonine/homoserine/homoserine lactone efflux protein
MLLLTLFKGIIVGIVIALPVGPVGVLCVRRTLFEGAMFGFVSGLGAATADTIFGLIAGYGLTFVSDWILSYEDWLSLVGAVFLFYLGLPPLLSHTKPEPEPLAGERLLGAYASTFALTITNPITILAFAAIFARVGIDEQAALLGIGMLVTGVFLGSLLWWLGLSFGIAWVQKRTSTVNLKRLNRASGAILTLSATGLLVSALFNLAAFKL